MYIFSTRTGAHHRTELLVGVVAGLKSDSSKLGPDAQRGIEAVRAERKGLLPTPRDFPERWFRV